MDLKERIALGSLALGVAIAVVAVIVFILNSFAGKASAEVVARQGDRLSHVELVIQRLDTNEEWIKSAVFALTQHAGIAVPPPPTSP